MFYNIYGNTRDNKMCIEEMLARSCFMFPLENMIWKFKFYEGNINKIKRFVV